MGEGEGKKDGGRKQQESCAMAVLGNLSFRKNIAFLCWRVEAKTILVHFQWLPEIMRIHVRAYYHVCV